MSIETGPGVRYVFASSDPLKGTSLRAIHKTWSAVVESEGDELISQALREVMAAKDRSIIDRFEEAGRYLMGTIVGNEGPDTAYDALVYVKGTDLRDNGAYSVVRMAKWARQSKRNMGFSGELLDDYVASFALTDVSNVSVKARQMPGGKLWGVPVDRLTVVKGFTSDESYIFGHRKEIEAVEGLEVSERLKKVLLATTHLHHEFELE